MSEWKGWDPTEEQQVEAFNAAWSLVRLQWEGAGQTAQEGWETAKSVLELYEQHDPRDLVFGLTRVGAILVRAAEIQLVEPEGPMSPEEARTVTGRRLIKAHNLLEWPEE